MRISSATYHSKQENTQLEAENHENNDWSHESTHQLALSHAYDAIGIHLTSFFFCPVKILSKAGIQLLQNINTFNLSFDANNSFQSVLHTTFCGV